MKEQLEKALAEEFPFMRRGPSLKEQREADRVDDLYGAFGLDCGDGWYWLIHDLCAEITAAYEAAGRPVDIEIVQVKEKYGILRFYYHTKSEPRGTELYQKVEELVARHEEKSGEVCEVCGAAGTLRRDLSWVLTLCDEHYREYAQREQKRTLDKRPEGGHMTYPAIKFGEFRKLCSHVNRISICMHETMNYENFDRIADVPHTYDEKYLWGVGGISEVFPGPGGKPDFFPCMEFVLSEKPREE